MGSLIDRLRRARARPSLVDLGLLLEATAIIVMTWLLLGWFFDRPITQSDGTVFWAPYTQSALHAGFDWTHHLYRFGVLGGSEMHDYAGTSPVVQLCGLVGASTTTTLNVVTIFIQLAFAFFGLKAIDALVRVWAPEPRPLIWAERITAVWACGFAPVIGWRLALGHENLLLGLLPFVAAVTLVVCTRARTLTVTTLAFTTFTVFAGVSSIGGQMLVYSVLFGLPIAIGALVDAPKGGRWSWPIAGVLVAGVLVALPRLAGMLAYASGDDASRTLGEVVTYSYGTASWADWLGSVPWTASWHATEALHERNFPIGPFAGMLIALWPRGRARWLASGLIVSAVLAVMFAGDVPPIAHALLAAVPPLGAFRVPARAILPLLVVIPALTLAVTWARQREPSFRVHGWCLAAGVVIIATGRIVGPVLREPLAWIVALGIVVAIRWRRAFAFPAALTILVALGVAAFDERFPRGGPVDSIEDGPRKIHAAALAQAPELASPLVRVQIVDAPYPFAISNAWAAGLSSLDGDYNPPRRFVELLSALTGRPIPATTVVFALTRSSAFPVLQQLYNIRYIVSVANDHGSIEELPASPGAAWFPEHVVIAEDAASIGQELRRGTVRDTAWLLRSDGAPRVAGCTGARVRTVTVDELGQAATLEVDANADCTLVVATNYVTDLRATAAGARLPTFPIDIALTGIAVPRGTSTIVLAPAATIPAWSRIGWLAGIGLLVAALFGFVWSSRRDATA